MLALACCLLAAPAQALTIKNLTEFPVVGFVRQEQGEYAVLQFMLQPGERARLEKQIVGKEFVIQANYALKRSRRTEPVTAPLKDLDCYVTIEIFENRLTIFVDDWPPGPVEVENSLKVDEREHRDIYPLPPSPDSGKMKKH